MARRAFTRVAATSAAAFIMAACASNSRRADTPTTQMNNALTQDERRNGWQLLFDGSSTAGWHTYRMNSATGWQVVDGELTTTGPGAGDLVSDRQFDSFELTLEWKVPPNGNSGVFYWAHEATEKIYENAPEMQILDNVGHRDGLSPLTAAGALYGLSPAPITAVRPGGEWNTARIIVKGSKVEHFLNDVPTGKGDFDSDELKALIAASKFNQWPTYGKSRRGHLGLQGDHGSVWFRNIYIRPLK
ncbi:MAG: DUF1080 domain-containing protein [Gemmatimonadales bacterium]